MSLTSGTFLDLCTLSQSPHNTSSTTLSPQVHQLISVPLTGPLSAPTLSFGGKKFQKQQWALAACPEFIACQYHTCQSLNKTGSRTQKHETPSMLLACTFFSNPYLEFCFLTPSFSSVILFHTVLHWFDISKIIQNCPGTTLKKVIDLSLLQVFSSFMQFPHQSGHQKLITSLINLLLAVFYR